LGTLLQGVRIGALAVWSWGEGAIGSVQNGLYRTAARRESHHSRRVAWWSWKSLERARLGSCLKHLS